MHSDPLDASLLLGESVPVVDSLQVEVSPSLNGRPTNSFRDNLRPEVSYITSWPGGGWTNQVMSMMNLIYLGLITDRIIIIPEFMPTHFAYDRPPLPFGDVFDIPRLVKELGQQVLEWREVKDQNSPVVDDIGCWSVWLSVQTGEKVPRGGQVTRILNLDVSYTKTPAWVKMKPNYVHDQHASVWGLAKLAFPTTREASLVPALPSPKHNVSLEPDEHLLCYDFLYYVAAHEPFEITKSDYSPAWRRAGKHMRWAPALEKLGDDCVRRTLGVKGDEPTPPFISVHMRHGDFKSWCPKGVAPNECFAPLSAVDRRVREVQAEVLQRKGIEVKHVIATSDEKNSTWWDQVAELGWRTPDHSQLEDVYGGWDSVLIDAVVQSQGVGYVGTERSTMSRLAGRRVQDWNDGPIKYVKWGRPGADD
ncbi:hypothetical protein FB451DRAFT_1388734 [Mycena latifolia]|nr:hypothetical protein FB451DRAFT_1388734 [Mycena latifolia]